MWLPLLQNLPCIPEKKSRMFKKNRTYKETKDLTGKSFQDQVGKIIRSRSHNKYESNWISQRVELYKHKNYPSIDDDSEVTSFGSEFRSASCIRHCYWNYGSCTVVYIKSRSYYICQVKQIWSKLFIWSVIIPRSHVANQFDNETNKQICDNFFLPSLFFDQLHQWIQSTLLLASFEVAAIFEIQINKWT